jgi:hypothetical protein
MTVFDFRSLGAFGPYSLSLEWKGVADVHGTQRVLEAAGSGSV